MKFMFEYILDSFVIIAKKIYLRKFLRKKNRLDIFPALVSLLTHTSSTVLQLQSGSKCLTVGTDGPAMTDSQDIHNHSYGANTAICISVSTGCILISVSTGSIFISVSTGCIFISASTGCIFIAVQSASSYQ